MRAFEHLLSRLLVVTLVRSAARVIQVKVRHLGSIDAPALRRRRRPFRACCTRLPRATLSD
jgi:hypothetical protein